MTSTLVPIQENYQKCILRIKEAALRTHRLPDSVKLLVVTKGQPAEKIKEVIHAGARLLGENYPEETAQKRQLLGDSDVEWHMIGHIQSRKIKYLTDFFSEIQSIESLETAEKVNQKFAEKKKVIPVLYEINISGEGTKQGFSAVDELNWPLLAKEFKTLVALSNLKCTGLMTMPPISAKPEDSRIYFRKLSKLSQYLKRELGEEYFQEISMGTSFDFEVAIEEGSTFVRIGESIMGPRIYQKKIGL